MLAGTNFHKFSYYDLALRFTILGLLEPVYMQKTSLFQGRAKHVHYTGHHYLTLLDIGSKTGMSMTNLPFQTQCACLEVLVSGQV